MLKRNLSSLGKARIVRHSELLDYYRKTLAAGYIKANPRLEKLLRKRAVRTLSGVAPVAVLTMPFPCPGKCAYCPTEKGVPQSYLSNEPAVMRAIRCGYDPCRQVGSRLRALENNGHEPTKIELIVIGGTWSVLPTKYKYWYIGQCFKAANEYGVKKRAVKCIIRNYNAKFKIESLKKFLHAEQEKNETSKYKIIGITLETRPDYISGRELMEMRELGCTRVELGAQTIDDAILKRNKRGHGVKQTADATVLLKEYGFKVAYHIMPGLPGSTPAKDLKLFKQLFSDERFRPDQIKFYPTVVTRGSLLYKWWRAGKYRPYSARQLQALIINCKKSVPAYVRIIRLIRDIPEESIVAGNRITNLRQLIQEAGAGCKCIRCREAKSKKLKAKSGKLKIIKYNASGGVEYFISRESSGGKTLYGFCRLRLPLERSAPVNSAILNGTAGRRSHGRSKTLSSLAELGSLPSARDGESGAGLKKSGLPEALREAALIRELHVYGELAQAGQKGNVQHFGLGKKLMAEAENIARQNGYEKIAVISGIGAREYYRKLGYLTKDTYMLKRLI